METDAINWRDCQLFKLTDSVLLFFEILLRAEKSSDCANDCIRRSVFLNVAPWISLPIGVTVRATVCRTSSRVFCDRLSARLSSATPRTALDVQGRE